MLLESNYVVLDEILNIDHFCAPELFTSDLPKKKKKKKNCLLVNILYHVSSFSRWCQPASFPLFFGILVWRFFPYLVGVDLVMPKCV